MINNNEERRCSNAVSRAIDNLNNSNFTLMNDSFGNVVLDVKDASLIWTNFAGTPNNFTQMNNLDQFGKDIRSFNLAITPEIADKLTKEGWNVRAYETNRPDYPVIHHIKVNVKIANPKTYDETKAFASSVYLITNFNGQEASQKLENDALTILDGRRMSNDDPQINIKKVNCIITGRKYHPANNRNAAQKITIQLTSMFVYADQIDIYTDPHEAELARMAVKTDYNR